MTNKIGCALFSFDRPQYLKQVLHSINENHKAHPILKDFIEFHFFQDGRNLNNKTVGSKKEVDESIKLLNKYTEIIPNSKLNCASENLGIARQKQLGHRLFDKYDKVIFFEDDMILSPHYIQLLVKMSKQFPENVVQACDRTGALPKDDFKNHLHKVIKSNCHLWGYLMSKSVCDSVYPKLQEYIKLIGNDYLKRPHEKIKSKFEIKASSHDAIIAKALTENNINKITTVVPRAKYIGEKGMHATPNWYKKFKFDKEKQYIFEEDQNIKNFELE